MPSGILTTDASAAGTATASAWPPCSSSDVPNTFVPALRQTHHVAGPARRADAAADHAGDEHPVALGDGGHGGADLLDRADELVPEVHARDRHRPVVQVQVAPADRRALHPQQAARPGPGTPASGTSSTETSRSPFSTTARMGGGP